MEAVAGVVVIDGASAGVYTIMSEQDEDMREADEALEPEPRGTGRQRQRADHAGPEGRRRTSPAPRFRVRRDVGLLADARRAGPEARRRSEVPLNAIPAVGYVTDSELAEVLSAVFDADFDAPSKAIGIALRGAKAAGLVRVNVSHDPIKHEEVEIDDLERRNLGPERPLVITEAGRAWMRARGMA